VKREIIVTSDGSHTLFVPELNESYHSTYGAVGESMHIFINAGFRYVAKNFKKLTILEIGFGTGLNAFLTLLEIAGKETEIYYHGIEAYPVEKSDAEQLNYPEVSGFPKAAQLFEKLYTTEWGIKQAVSNNFSLLKEKNRLEEAILPADFYNLVYFDAFSPEVQPEMWRIEIFRKIYSAMKPDGVLVTYSCKGDVKRALKSVGFKIEKLPGPPGKREFLRAVKL